MKRVRLQRCGGQLLQARAAARAATSRPTFLSTTRLQQHRCASAAAAAQESTAAGVEQIRPSTLPPSPLPQQAAKSAKLAALHGRLSLSSKVPLETLARALVVPSADPNANFNNSSLAFLGSTFINYHVLEYLLVKWPRLPQPILYEALRAYAGNESLHQVARRWGVEAAAAPGGEVDPGLLQWKPETAASSGVQTRWGYVRPEDVRQGSGARRGLSSRVVLDDDFGDKVEAPVGADAARQHYQHEAYASFVQAVVGSIYAHCGREAARDFVQGHVLSRQIDLSAMFEFQLPTRELSMLCAREGFEAPVARLESETGRRSRTPVYVVGIYSGVEKLGEGTGPSLDTARWKASMNVLKAWYMYSPGNKVRVPSDMFATDAKPWTAPHIDIGEII